MGLQDLSQRQSYGWEARTAFDAEGTPSRNGAGPDSRILATKRPKLLGERSGTPSTWRQKDWESGGGIVSGFFSDLNLSGAEELTSPYRELSIVHTCIKAKASAMLQAPLVLYSGDPLSDDEAEPLPRNDRTAGPIYDLLGRPSQHQTGEEFRQANLTHRCLDGETVWFLMDAEGRPLEPTSQGRIPVPHTIVPVIGKSVEIVCGDRGLPEFFVYPSKQRTRFPAHSVIQFRDYDPDNPLRGLGPVEALQRELCSEFAAQRHQEGIFANGGDPGGWIISERDAGPDKRKATQAKLDDDYGNANNAGRWRALYGKNIQVVQARLTPKDLEYPTMRALNREYTAAALGVPLTLIGNDSDAKYANYLQAQRALWVGPLGIISYLRSEEAVLNRMLLQRLAVPGIERVVARHDLSVVRVLQDDDTDRIDKASQVAARGHGVSINAALEAMGSETAVDGGDLPLYHHTLRPTVEVPEGAAPPPPKDEGKAIALDPLVRSIDGEERKAWARAYVDQRERAVDAERAELADAALRYLRKYEVAQIKRLKSYAAGEASAPAVQTRDYLANEITEADIIQLLLDPGEWASKLNDAAAGPVTNAFAAAAEDVAQEIGGVVLTLEDERLLQLIQTQLTQLSTGVAGSYDSTLAKKVKAAILDVFEGSEGVSVGSLQDAVRELLPELRGSLKVAFADRDARALAIARTETGKAQGTARFESMTRSDVVTQHEWIDADDDEVRDSHSELDGQVRNLGDEFKPGLRYPLDPNGPASEVVNCRCSALPVIPEPTT